MNLSDAMSEEPTRDRGQNSNMLNRDERILMISSVLLIGLAGFEALATTTIMPSVMLDLDALGWFSISSGAALASQLTACVIAGPIVDRFGPRRVLLVGTAFFAIGLVTSALAPHVAVFVLGRILQGIGAGWVTVPLYALVGSVATDQHRASFFAAFSLAWVLPSLIGPAIAGWVTQFFGWRWIFAVLPIMGVFSLLPILPLLKRLAPSTTTETRPLGKLPIFAVLAGVGVLAIQISGTRNDALTWTFFGAGFLLVVVFLPRLVPRGTFLFKRGMPSIIATRLLSLAALAGASAFLPLLLQSVHQWSPAIASIAVTIGSLSWAAGATAQARIHDPMQRQLIPRWGTGLMVLGLVPVALLTISNFPVWIALVGWFIAGAGIGITHSTLSDLTLGMSKPAEHGSVSSWLQVADNSGSALILAVTSVLLPVWMATVASGRAGASHADAFAGKVDSFIYAPACVLPLIVALLAWCAARRIPKGTTHSSPL